jgi:N-acetylmuramic acid 6-phosphate etherase
MSTLIMGRMDRYESNIMTWVKPSNYKLIDRASRYVLELLKRDGIIKSYNEVSKAVIELSGETDSNIPIVLRVCNSLKQD